MRPFRERFDRTLDISIEPGPEGQQVGAARLVDSVHDMRFLAHITRDGRIAQMTSVPTRRPFPACVGVIDQSGPGVWRGVSLHDLPEIRRRRQASLGCEHIAELVERLAFAVQRGIGALRLNLKSVLDPRVPIEQIQTGLESIMTVELRAWVNERSAAELFLALPVEHQALGVKSLGSSVTHVLADGVELSGLERRNTRKAGENVARMLEGDLSPRVKLVLELVAQLLGLYRETQRALLGPDGGNEVHQDSPVRRDGQVALASLIRQGTVGAIRCGVFRNDNPS